MWHAYGGFLTLRYQRPAFLQAVRSLATRSDILRMILTKLSGHYVFFSVSSFPGLRSLAPLQIHVSHSLPQRAFPICRYRDLQFSPSEPIASRIDRNHACRSTSQKVYSKRSSLLRGAALALYPKARRAKFAQRSTRFVPPSSPHPVISQGHNRKFGWAGREQKIATRTTA